MPRPNRCQGLLKTRIFNVNTIIEGPWQNRFINTIHLSLKWHSPLSQDGDDFTFMGLKTGMLNISEHGKCSTSKGFSLGDWSNAILFIHLFFQHCSCFHRNTRQHSDPHCVSQSVVDSSSNKMFAPLPGYDWFLCWHYCSSAFCCFFDGNRKWQQAYS